ncbi:hypothetical protein [Salinibacillus xinjiangensis]|uniref:Uncharacterized protein n=1 Tax=Salinibacillus xinjiangensis TaxID=1229268 RepID=A0A6G1X551_9BACI|nr:hypothetical protein [Salinibacillus xinjiangensis]MRG86035.1 hypothetical protein [Salinibacillus xinjiangensis]
MLGCSSDTGGISEESPFGELQKAISEELNADISLIPYEPYPLTSAFYVRTNDGKVINASLIYSKVEGEKELLDPDDPSVYTAIEKDFIFGPYKGERMIGISIERSDEANINFDDPTFNTKEVKNRKIYYYEDKFAQFHRLNVYIPSDEVVYGLAFEMNKDKEFRQEYAFDFMEELIESMN